MQCRDVILSALISSGWSLQSVMYNEFVQKQIQISRHQKLLVVIDSNCHGFTGCYVEQRRRNFNVSHSEHTHAFSNNNEKSVKFHPARPSELLV
jgi:hypothetical protein